MYTRNAFQRCAFFSSIHRRLAGAVGQDRGAGRGGLGGRGRRGQDRGGQQAGGQGRQGKLLHERSFPVVGGSSLTRIARAANTQPRYRTLPVQPGGRLPTQSRKRRRPGWARRASIVV